MKPLYLELEGLNSFLEVQKIDFEKLTRRGIFGIFGPTGSGKSTILDALILALYGRIPRAGSRLSGVVNSSADYARVVYEFALNSGINQGTYRVERTLRRNRAGGIRTEQALLARVSGEVVSEVIAEQTQPVNKAVEELVGLNGDDFMRSVVLPQGSFSQFLHLSGSERSNMLERLFALEDYGRNMIIRLKEMQAETLTELNTLQGALGVLTDAEAGNIRTAQVAWQRVYREEKLLLGKLQVVRAEHEKMYQRWLWSREYRELIRELTEMKAESSLQKARYDAYEKLQRAALLKEGTTHLIELENKIQELSLTLNGLRAELEILQPLFETEKSTYLRLQETREKDLPQWLVEQEQLKQALKTHEKLENLAKVIAELKHNIATDLEKQKTVQSERVQLEQKWEECRQAYAEQEEEWQKVNLSAQQRDLLNGVLLRERERQEWLTRLAELEEKLEQEQTALDNFFKAHALLVEEKRQHTELLNAKEEALRIVQEDLASQEKQLRSWENENLALMLAEDLVAGNACPVCGSLEHPAPACARTDSEERKRLIEASREAALSDGQRLEGELAELQKQLEQIEIELALKNRDKEHHQFELERLKNQKRESIKDSLAVIRVTDGYRINYNYRDPAQLQQAIAERDRQSERLNEKLKVLQNEMDRISHAKEQNWQTVADIEGRLRANQQTGRQKAADYDELKKEYAGHTDPEQALAAVEEKIKRCQDDYQIAEKQYIARQEELQEHLKQQAMQQRLYEETSYEYEQYRKRFSHRMEELGFADVSELQRLFEEERGILTNYNLWQEYERQYKTKRERVRDLQKELSAGFISDERWESFQTDKSRLEEAANAGTVERSALQEQLSRLLKAWQQKKVLLQKYAPLEQRYGLLDELDRLLRGKKFVEYIARRQMLYIVAAASDKLKEMTFGRYSLELDDDNEFVICDAYNAGARRSVKTLSGGETFLASLSLALALSAQIQLGKATLEFFFLDEGFGTLDTEMLETVMDALGKLRQHNLTVGLISHMEAIKERIDYSLTIIPADAVNGSRIVMNTGG